MYIHMITLLGYGHEKDRQWQVGPSEFTAKQLELKACHDVPHSDVQPQPTQFTTMLRHAKIPAHLQHIEVSIVANIILRYT